MGHMQSGKCPQMTLLRATPLPFRGSRIAALPVVAGACAVHELSGWVRECGT